MAKMDIKVKIGDILYIECLGKNGAYSMYELKITQEVIDGDGLDDAFLSENYGEDD